MAVLKIEVEVDDKNAAAKLREVEAAVKGVEGVSVQSAQKLSAFSASLGTLKQMAGALVTADLIGRIVGGLGELASEAFRTAGRLVDLSQKTGLSMKTLQQMQFIAKQTGASLEQFSQAALRMGVNIEKSNGKDGAAKAVRELGLSLSDLKNSSPDEVYNKIITAAGKMEDVNKRNWAVITLGGKGAASVLTAIGEGYDALASKAPIAADAQILAMEALQDEWEALKDTVHASTVNMLGSMALVVKGARSMGFMETMATMLSGGWSGGSIAMMMAGQGFDGNPKKGKDVFLGSQDPEIQVEDSDTAADRAAARAMDAMRKRRADMTGGSDIADAKEMLADMRAVGGLTRLTDDATEALHTTLGKAISAYQRLGQVAPRAMHDAWVATLQTPKMLTGGLNPADFKGTDAGIPWSPAMLPGIGVTDGLPAGVGTQMPMPGMPAKADSFMKSSFGSAGQFAGNLSGAVMGAITGGGSIGSAVGGVLGGGLMSGLGKHLTAGLAKTGLQGILGSSLNAILPGIGALMGPLIGKAFSGIGKLFGFGKGKEAKETAATRDQVVQQLGGMQELKKTFDQLGLSSDKFFNAKKPKEFAAEVEKLNKAMEAQKNLQEGISKITEGANARATIFGEQFKATKEKATSSAEGFREWARSAGMSDALIDEVLGGDAASQKSSMEQNFQMSAQMDPSLQSGLNVTAAGAYASFSQQIGQGTSAVDAIASLTPALTTMRDVMAGSNFEMSVAGTKLMELAAIIEANRIPFQSLAADGQILQGMMQGNIRDFDLFRAVATDIGVQMQGMIDKGVPTAQVLALAQPQLQALWEAQQKWHFELDGTTQALMDQAVQQGIVGANMKDVNQKILDILIAIGDVLGAKIPDALRGLPGAAQEAANGMNAAFSGVRPPDMGPGVMYHSPGEISTETGETAGYYGGGGEGGDAYRANTGGAITNASGGTVANYTPNVTVNVHGSLVHQDELGDVVTQAVINSVRANTNSSFTGLRAALEMPT